jgi:hypothetical protein
MSKTLDLSAATPAEILQVLQVVGQDDSVAVGGAQSEKAVSKTRSRRNTTGTLRRHSFAERKLDLYETPVEAVTAMILKSQQLNPNPLPIKIWEPCCGPGMVTKELRAWGFEVFASDIEDYQCPNSFSGRDFLLERAAPEGFDCIYTNPPYKLKERFVWHARDLVRFTVMLLPLSFIAGRRRRGLFAAQDLRAIYAFENRLPHMHRAGWEGKKASSQVEFAWFVWDREYRGEATISRISWRDAVPHVKSPDYKPPEQKMRRVKYPDAYTLENSLQGSLFRPDGVPINYRDGEKPLVEQANFVVSTVVGEVAP